MCLLCMFYLAALPVLGSHAFGDGCLPLPSAPALRGFMVEAATIATLGLSLEETILCQVVGPTAGKACLLCPLPLGCFPLSSNTLQG